MAGLKAETSWQRGVVKQKCPLHSDQEAEQGQGLERYSFQGMAHATFSSWPRLLAAYFPANASVDQFADKRRKSSSSHLSRVSESSGQWTVKIAWHRPCCLRMGQTAGAAWAQCPPVCPPLFLAGNDQAMGPEF